jgi:hypothetical protein
MTKIVSMARMLLTRKKTILHLMMKITQILLTRIIDATIHQIVIIRI